MNHKLNLKDIVPISELSEAFSHAEHDYIFSHLIFHDERDGRVPEVFSFDGLTVEVVLKGEIKVTVNSKSYRMREKTVSVLDSNCIMSASPNKESEVYTLFLSTDFINSIHFDINIINPRHFINHDPLIKLDSKEAVLVCRFLDILHHCAVENAEIPKQVEVISHSIGRSLVVALLYQLALIVEKHEVMHESKQAKRVNNRKMHYVQDFMSHLQENYRSERSVSFYASKLCISPKYLSLLVKEATGQTAASLIDRYVINEAKNLLRFSGLTVQQVSYKLNFPNQSAFGKYFKHLTGDSPSTFRSK